MATAQKKPRQIPTSLDALRANMTKRYGEGRIMVREDFTGYTVTSTGSLSLDLALRVGGWTQGRIHEVMGPEGVSKGHPLSTRVLTPEGWRKVGDLVVGDEVIGSNGYPTQVTGVYDRGVLPVFRVTMTDKSSVLCDGDHLWHTISRKGKEAVLSTGELQQRALIEGDGSGRYKIPMVAPVQYPERDLPISPYLMGALLANGGLSSGGVITTNDESVISEIRLEGNEVTEHARSDARRWYVRGLRPALRTLGLWGSKSADKFIPELYLRASVAQRHTLLQALMDCDGHADAEKGKPSYASRSLALAEGVQELVHSLGGNASVCGPYLGDDGGTNYRVNIWLPSQIEPFRTPRKAERRDLIGHREPVRKIKSIEAEGSAEVRCIRVAAEDSLYVTECHIVTHNTTLCVNGAREMQAAQPDRAIGFIDMEQTFDWDWAEEHGLDTSASRFMYALPDHSEDVADQAHAMMETGLVSMLIIDSIGGMESKQAFDKEAGEVVMGRNAQVITRLSKRLAVLAQRHKVTVLLVNQPRANISNPMGMDESAGPKAMKHSTTTKVRLSRTGEPPMKVKFPGEKDPEVVGTQFRARVERNKVAAAGKAGEYWLINQESDEYGGIGISKAHEAMDIGTYLGVIKQEGGGYYRFPWTETDKQRIRGKEQVLEFLRENDDRMLEVRDLAIKAMKGDVVPEAAGHVVDAKTGEVLA